ncbi:MAG: hypothetical protein V1808_03895 [Candidatus Daviesbacteria bacterium]
MAIKEVHRSIAVLPTALYLKAQETANIVGTHTLNLLRSSINLKLWMDEKRTKLVEEGQTGEIRVENRVIIPDLLLTKYPLANYTKVSYNIPEKDFRVARTQGMKFTDYLKQATVLTLEMIDLAKQQGLYGSQGQYSIPFSIGSQDFVAIL